MEEMCSERLCVRMLVCYICVMCARDVTIHNLNVSIYIATCVSRYSDILHDIIKCKLTDF